jgi:AraC family transcriptional regulator, transcriptional activator of pobA
MDSPTINTRDKIPRHDLELLHERSIPFDARRVQDFDKNAWADYPHRHSFYEIHMVQSGSGIHHVDDHEYEIEKGAIYFLSPEEVQHWKLTSPLKGLVMVFKEEFLLHDSSGVSVLDDLSFFHRSDRGNVFQPDAKGSRHLKRYFENIITEAMEQQIGWENVVRALTHIFLIEIQRSLHGGESSVSVSRKLTVARQFRRLVDRHAVSERQVAFYADKLNLSGGHLHTVVREIFDGSPGQMISEAVVREAKRRLTYTEASVAEIGYALNFDDPSYFSRLFRKHMGQSPSAYRESLSK